MVVGLHYAWDQPGDPVFARAFFENRFYEPGPELYFPKYAFFANTYTPIPNGPGRAWTVSYDRAIVYFSKSFFLMPFEDQLETWLHEMAHFWGEPDFSGQEYRNPIDRRARNLVSILFYYTDVKRELQELEDWYIKEKARRSLP